MPAQSACNISLRNHYTVVPFVQETKLSSVVTAHTLQPAEGQGTSALIELCLRLPGTARSAKLSIAFHNAFLTVFDHPPDANRGFDMPSALVTNLHALPLLQVSCLAACCAGQTRALSCRKPLWRSVRCPLHRIILRPDLTLLRFSP